LEPDEDLAEEEIVLMFKEAETCRQAAQREPLELGNIVIV